MTKTEILFTSLERDRMSKVNLDALIPRDDFAVIGDVAQTTLFENIGTVHLRKDVHYPLLRKPDFQRETSEWSKKQIGDLIESFINGDLIPAIILWRSNTGLYFVLDGSHRLSALISWMYDDYGDGEISRKFYDHNISDGQIELAIETRKYINKRIGAFKDMKADSTNPRYVDIFKNANAYQIKTQWLTTTDADKAERSFFKINKQGVALNPTEIKLLESRKKGNCIAARAIISRGTGHKYWKDFHADTQNKITAIAAEINDILFSPSLKTPIKTLDIPIAGKIISSSTLPLVFDFINIVNNIDLAKIKDDAEGTETLACLQKARQVAWRINSNHTSSLGLHPAVYFYSSLGRHQPTAVLAMIELLLQFQDLDFYKNFIGIRKDFEHFFIKYKTFVNQVTRKFGSGTKGYIHLKDLYWLVIDLLTKKKYTETQILTHLANDENFKFLNPQESENDGKKSKKFTSETKSGIFLKDALPAKLRCKICGGHIHINSITSDHIQRIREGGIGVIENGQLAHPYCNTTVKR